MSTNIHDSAVVDPSAKIGEGVTIHRGTSHSQKTEVGSDCLLMANVHVAHDCVVGNHVILANVVTLGGHVAVDDWAYIGGLSGVHQFIHIVTSGLSRFALSFLLPSKVQKGMLKYHM